MGMHRRTFLAATAALGVAAVTPVGAAEPMLTRWVVTQSEAFDAIVFLDALSGTALYQRYYRDDAAAFGANLQPAIRAEIVALWNEAREAKFGLLGPILASTLSGAHPVSIGDVVDLLAAPERSVLPAYRLSRNYSDADWRWLNSHANRLGKVFGAIRDADFAGFRRSRTGDIDQRIAELSHGLAGFDVTRWQSKLVGRPFDPTITVILLAFSKPHGMSLDNQRFLQAVDYDVTTTVRIAAHEMLHPPFAMNGPVGLAVREVLANDELVMRIVRDHDPQFGYTTLEGLVDEDIVEALDQIISEKLGVARNPADRWRDADDGMHVLAAGFYGLLRQDGWQETGGSIEQWFARAVAGGRLKPEVLHPAAARVMERPVLKLWPIGNV